MKELSVTLLPRNKFPGSHSQLRRTHTHTHTHTHKTRTCGPSIELQSTALTLNYLASSTYTHTQNKDVWPKHRTAIHCINIKLPSILNAHTHTHTQKRTCGPSTELQSTALTLNYLASSTHTHTHKTRTCGPSTELQSTALTLNYLASSTYTQSKKQSVSLPLSGHAIWHSQNARALSGPLSQCNATSWSRARNSQVD